MDDGRADGSLRQGLPGGFVIADDFGAVDGCRKAILEFRERRGIPIPLCDIDGYGAVWRKSPEEAAASPALAEASLRVVN